MDDRLSALDDGTAARLLTKIAAPRLRHSASAPPELTPELSLALEQAFGIGTSPSTEGELARDVLRFLATDADMQQTIAALLDGPEAERFEASPTRGLGKTSKTIGVVVAALMVLQTHLKLERAADGKWKVLVEKEATSAEVLGPIVQKLLALPGGVKKP